VINSKILYFLEILNMRLFLILFFAHILAFSSAIAKNSTDAPDEKSRLIAFSSNASSNDKHNIFIMDENGNNAMQVSFKDLDCYSPRFSPDGKKIVFCATNKISDYIYMIDLEDTVSFRWPKFIDGGNDPVFSSDGLYLLYRSEKNLDNALYIMDLSSDSSYLISDGSLSTHANFSADGRKIIYSSSLNKNFDLVVLDLEDTTDNAQLTVAASKDAEIYGTFSPDGNLIAYSSFDINYKGTVHVCSADGGSDIAVSKGMGSSYNPKFSPDGKKLAFVSNKTGNFELYAGNADGSDIRQLTNNKGNTIEFDWYPDGTKIVFEDMSDAVSSINVLNIETGEIQNLTGENANNINPNIQKNQTHGN
jgi:TolB protein